MFKDRRRSLFLAAVLIGLAVCVVSVQAACDKGCDCLTKAEAEKLHYVICGEKLQVCDDALSKIVKYCFRKQVTPAPVQVKCDEGCSCLDPAKATAAGYLYCDTPHAVCDYDDNNNPLYCFRKPEPVTVPSATCADGCSCMAPEKATAAGYTYCNGEQVACNKDSAGNLQYCYGKPVTEETTTVIPVKTVLSSTTVKPVSCAKGCSCLDAAMINKTGYRYCGETKTLCGYEKTTGNPLNCFEKVGTKAPVQESPAAPAKGTPAVPTIGRADEDAGFPAPQVRKAEPVGFFSGIVDLILGRRCPVGETRCSGECVDLQFSESNCGACDSSCPAGLICWEGECGFMREGGYTSGNCPEDWLLCGDRCVDLQADGQHCGRCGTVCYPDEICCGGTCVRKSGEGNCGSCGNVCPAGSPCMDGGCNPAGCFYGLSQCGNTCVNLRTDPTNCGTCGHLCSYICRDGSCATCMPGTEVCGDSCVDLSSDRENCGTCRNRCAEDAVCEEGTCVTCGAKLREMGGSPIIFTRCGNSCVDLQSDAVFCGDCETPCPAGQACCGGSCHDLSREKDNCGECGTTCGSGEKCIDGACRDLASDVQYCGETAMTCPDFWACCGGLCTNILENDRNCGGCGNVCTSPDYTCCSGVCVDTRTDAGYCGGCNTRCDSSEICRNGQCEPRLCGDTGRECTSQERCCDGQCVSIQDDEDNCGVCGNVCQGAEECCKGACTDFSLWYDDELNCGGCGIECGDGETCCDRHCVDVDWDEDHCGWCGHECPPFYECCDGQCKNVLRDKDNCGSCGRACRVQCTNGACCGLFNWVCI